MHEHESGAFPLKKIKVIRKQNIYHGKHLCRNILFSISLLFTQGADNNE